MSSSKSEVGAVSSGRRTDARCLKVCVKLVRLAALLIFDGHHDRRLSLPEPCEARGPGAVAAACREALQEQPDLKGARTALAGRGRRSGGHSQ
jgi:hypothetical protein